LGRQAGKDREIRKNKKKLPDTTTTNGTSTVDIARMLIEGDADLTTQNRKVVQDKEGEKQEDWDKGRVLLTEVS